jgi:hypothetical protein
MRARKVIGVLLLFAALIVLNTCQLQFNKSSGNNVALRVVVPGGMTGGGKSVPGSKSLTNGTTLTVTINQEGTSFSTQQTAPIGGNSSFDFSFSLSSSGTYDVSAIMEDASEDILASAKTKLTVPSGNYPVVLAMYSNFLLNVVFADSYSPPDTIATGFIPPPFTTTTIYPSCDYYNPPLTLTLTTVDPQATVTSVTESYNSIIVVDSHTGSTYTLTDISGYNDAVTILVKGQDGTTQTYVLTLNFGC